MRRLILLQAAGWLPLLRKVIEQQSGPLTDQEGILEQELGNPRPPRLVDLLRGATQDHHFKYAAAAIEEAARSPAAVATRILAVTASYLPGPEAEETEHHRLAWRALQRA